MKSLTILLTLFTSLGAGAAVWAVGGAPSRSGKIQPVVTQHDNQEEEEEEGDDDDQEIETTIPWEKAPRAVRAAIKEIVPSKIETLKAEKLFGHTVYEASWDVDGVENEVVVNGDGHVMLLEYSMTAKDAPEAVRTAATKEFGESTITFEKKMFVLYAVEAETEDGEEEILLNANGQEIEIDAESDDQEAHADQDDDQDDEHESDDDDDVDDDDDDLR